jgi:uncharacterized damage-inducible protein DinB
MSIAKEFLAEFEEQAPVTRKFLERLPEDKLTWKPHEKSMTAGQLAFHIAKSPAEVLRLVVNSPVQVRDKFEFPQPENRSGILAAHDEGVVTIRDLLPAFSDAAMNETWRLVKGERDLMSLPRAGVLRDIMLSHWYQHRGQFSVYLRILNVPVPSTWGPSADEAPRFMQQEEAVVA